MTDRPKALRVSLSELELLDIKVTRDGGAVRYLEGARYGIGTSIFQSEIVPGSGPPAHSHPYTELFVVHAGHGRFEVDDVTIEAEAGDIVIVPSGAWHAFESLGEGPLRQTAIHEAPAFSETRRPDASGGA